jgi:hypothetical protein
MTNHASQHNGGYSGIKAPKNDSEIERELLASIQRELLIRFLKTNVLAQIHDHSLIQFVSDNVSPNILHGDTEYRVLLQGQGIDAENFHAITSEGQVLLHTLINRWVLDQNEQK